MKSNQVKAEENNSGENNESPVALAELSAFHRGVDAAKDAIRATGSDDWEGSQYKPYFINAIARLCGLDNPEVRAAPTREENPEDIHDQVRRLTVFGAVSLAILERIVSNNRLFNGETTNSKEICDRVRMPYSDLVMIRKLVQGKSDV